jgi:DNA-binding NarL/FixJ family response regulator
MTEGTMSCELPRRIRVVVVDDQPLIRQGFSMILSAHSDIEVVGEAGDGSAALEVIGETHPDVVLMDIRMPVLDGIEATRLLRRDSPGSKVLILTTFAHDDYVTYALSAGASGFVLKDATPDELLHAVRVVAGGDALLSPAVTTRLIERLLPSLSSTPGRPVSSPLGLETLTEREVEVLRLVATGRSNAEIAGELYISEATVKTHVSHVLTKLGLRDRVQAVIAAYEMGLLQPGHPADPN